MANNIVNLFSNALSNNLNIQAQHTVAPVSSNPFANPFVNMTAHTDSALYAKNKPVSGGYFAGYHNGKPNIVGRKLFLEV